MRLLWVFTAGNAAILWLASFLDVYAVTAPGPTLALALVFTLGSFMAAVTPFTAVVVVGRGREFGAFSLILLNGLVFIAVCAQIYRVIGFGNDSERPTDLWTALYFSTVTFTTLGYGDYQPKGPSRAVAAMQALFGYVYLGLLVGAAGRLGRGR